jgi:hypothetical protein
MKYYWCALLPYNCVLAHACRLISTKSDYCHQDVLSLVHTLWEVVLTTGDDVEVQVRSMAAGRSCMDRQLPAMHTASGHHLMPAAHHLMHWAGRMPGYVCTLQQPVALSYT